MKPALAAFLSFIAPAVGALPPSPTLLEAARTGRLASVRALVEGGADVNGASASGVTPLMEAVSAGRTEVARVLLDAGAVVDARDRLGRTALDFAEGSGRADLARLLRSRGARGSGKSVGDTACVRKWAGDGFCGVIERVEPTRLRLRVTRVEGCVGGCDADECSGGDRIAGPSESLDRQVWIKSWCLTQTYPGSAR
jgi:ankyrin repeat protein